MTENPFGEGGFDLGGLLQQAQAMQEQMLAAQAELSEATVDGTVAGGLVTVTLSGVGDLVGVRIRKGSFDPEDTEDLEDMIVAAYRDARAKADSLASEMMGPLAQGMPGAGPIGGPDLPAGF